MTIANWLTYARRLAFKYGRGLHRDEQYSAAGWALATALRNYDHRVPFAAYLARGVRMAVQCERGIVDSCGLTAYGQTKAPPRPKRVPLRPIRVDSRYQDDADARDLLSLLDTTTADTLWRYLCGESVRQIARARRCRALRVKAEISSAINQLREKVA